MDYWALVNPYCDAVSFYDGPVRFFDDIAKLPDRSRHLLTAHLCQYEVCNGGFDQLFWNSTGILTPEAVSAFRAIGLPNTATVVEEAIAAFGPSFPRDRAARQRALDVMREKCKPSRAFANLDDRFYALIETEHGGWNAAADEFAGTT